MIPGRKLSLLTYNLWIAWQPMDLLAKLLKRLIIFSDLEDWRVFLCRWILTSDDILQRLLQYENIHTFIKGVVFLFPKSGSLADLSSLWFRLISYFMNHFNSIRLKSHQSISNFISPPSILNPSVYLKPASGLIGLINPSIDPSQVL